LKKRYTLLPESIYWEMPPQKWIFVCSSNLVRSVIAEAITRELAPEIDVDSVGLCESVQDAYKRDGERKARRLLPPVMRTFLANKGWGMEGKRARGLTAFDVETADIIWVMTETHKLEALKQFPSADGKVYLLGKSNITDSWKADLRPEHLQKWVDQIAPAVQARIDECRLALVA
jgi:protein-tyrosine-phosphatase